MANNLLDRLLSLTGLKAPEFESENTTYSDDGLTGVERYLANQNNDQEQQITDEDTLSSVERYLQAQAEKAESSQAKPLSGVEKYLANQDKQQESKPTSVSKKTAAVKKPVSGVDKYLNQQTSPEKNKTSVKKKNSKPVAKKPAAEKKPTKKVAVVTKQKGVEKPSQKAKTKVSAGRIDLSVNANQCQSGTARGGQCKRSTSLMKLQRTINKQKYQFLVCSQHHNDTFKPFKGLV